MVDALVESQKGVFAKPSIKILYASHYDGYSVVKINFTGELSDLIFLGIWSQFTLQQTEKLGL